MAKLDFPAASASPWVAPNNVIYTYIGTSPNGYWEANTANAATDLPAIFVERTGSTMTGALKLDNAGSVSLPDISFDGDVNTGLYSPGADSLAITTAGTQRVIVDNAGASKFSGDIQATKPRSSTAGSNTGGLCINPSDSTIYYNFRIDQVDNALRIDTTAGADRIVFTNDGGSQFASTTTVGGGALSGGAAGVSLYPTGGIHATQSSGTSTILSGYIQGSSSKNVAITAAGTATFAGVGTFSGDLRVQDGGNFRVRTAADAASDAILLQNNGNITASGGATFAGRVDVGGLTVDSNLTPTSGTSVEHFYGTTGGVIQAFDRDNGNLEPLQVRGSTWALSLDGSATFGADLTINGLTVGLGASSISSNTAVGKQAIYSATSGHSNVACGAYALRQNTTGIINTATGYSALYTNTTGSYNTAVGKSALYYNTTGGNNTAVGFQASVSNTTGGGNTSCGQDALGDNTTGNSNTAMGYRALTANTTANQNAAFGFEALRYNSTGVNNVAVGLHSSYGNTTGGNNVSVGVNSAKSNQNGGENTAVGYKASENNVSGNYNTSLGATALKASTSNYNTSVGWRSLYSQTSGTINTAVGAECMYSNTGGNYNCALGYGALRQNTGGQRSVALGYQSLYSNISGGNHTSVGMYANYYNSTGNGNDSFGYTALHRTTTGDYNTAIGYQSLHENTTGSRNTALGLNTLYSNTTGNFNIGLGREGLFGCTTGSANIGIGGNNSVGAYTPVFNVTTQNNRLVAGGTNITNAYVQVSWTVTSDERDKMNFAPVPYGLDFINQLKPTAYQFKVDRDTETPNGDVRYGFKAQDILALEGDNPVIIDIEDPDHLKYKGEHLVPVLVNAVQELTTMVKDLQAEIKTLKG